MTVEKRWQQILASALDGAVVEPNESNARPDLLIRTRDGHSIAIEVKWAGEGWPQDVRRAAANVPEHWPADVVLLAHQLSPGAIEWLRDRGANWADEGGQARILGPDGLIVIREPARLPREDRASRPFAWSPSAITIAEAILASEDQPLRATGLARRSGWSVPQAGNVLKAFDAQGWTIKRGTARGPRAHRRLVDSGAMLAAWSAAVADAPRATRIAHRATRDVMTLLREELAPALDGTATWAVSGWAGLELAAPFATTTPSLHIYVADDDFAGPLSSAIEAAGLREVDEGGRVTFWSADARVLELATRRGDVPVASSPRLYADLSAFGARGQDAADHVREQLIDPLHPKRTADKNSADG
jgi:Transcriptional regulator, AbiEi antitoxin, Type IV TA system